MSSSRPSRSRSFLLTTAALGVVVLGGWLALSLLLDPAHLQDELQRAVYKSTGRDLTIAGPVTLHIGFNPSLEVGGVAISNVAGGSRPQMITAQSLSARLALLPLLAGDAVIDSVTITGADILLEAAPDGTPNWRFAPPHKALFQAAPGASSGGTGGTGGTGRVAITGITLVNGQLTWQPAQGAPRVFGITTAHAWIDEAQGATHLDLAASSGTAPFTLAIQGGSLERLRGGPVAALAGDWPLTVDATGGGVTAHLEGGIAHPDQGRGYKLRLTANAPDLSTISTLLPAWKIPPLQNVSLSTALADDTAGTPTSSELQLHAGAVDLSQYVPGLLIKQLALVAPGPGQLAQLTLDGTYDNAPLRLQGTASQPDRLAPGAPVAVTITGQAASADFSARGTLPPGWGLTGLDVQLSAKIPDLSILQTK